MTDRLKGGRALTDEELEAVSGGDYHGPTFFYKVRTGDTLENIAGRFGTTVSEISYCNGYEGGRFAIYDGMTIKVPNCG